MLFAGGVGLCGNADTCPALLVSCMQRLIPVSSSSGAVEPAGMHLWSLHCGVCRRYLLLVLYCHPSVRHRPSTKITTR